MLRSVKKYDGYEDPIKTKEELMFHVGFRQFVARFAILFPFHLSAISFLVANI